MANKGSFCLPVMLTTMLVFWMSSHIGNKVQMANRKGNTLVMGSMLILAVSKMNYAIIDNLRRNK